MLRLEERVVLIVLRQGLYNTLKKCWYKNEGINL